MKKEELNELIVKDLESSVKVNKKQIAELQFKVSDLAENRVSVIDANAQVEANATKMRHLSIKLDQITSQQLSLENWVDKYLPLKVHHNVCEMLEEVVSPDQQHVLKDRAWEMAGVLRKEIFEDLGFSRLKKRALDLIT